MRSLRDILVFKTPFEDENSFRNKFDKIEEMFEDYINNAWIPLDKKEINDEFFEKYEFINDTFWINISFSFKKDLASKDYFPAILVSYFLDDMRFEKKNIENFLNDNIKFIYNVFFDEFFVDYDKKFDINDINKWKKIDLWNFKKFNLENKQATENKQILDSMMYTYFTLVKTIFNIESNSNEIGNLIKWNSIWEENMLLFGKRADSTKENLANNAIAIKKQIDIFVDLIS